MCASPAGKYAKALTPSVRFSPAPRLGAVATSTVPPVTRMNLRRMMVAQI